jgi:hypothetical protein
MTAFNYSTQWLLETVQRLESVAVSSQTFSEEDIIEFLNLELQTIVVPLIQSVNEEYGSMTFDVPSSELGETLPIPSQATGQRLRSVQLVTPDGRLINIARLDPNVLGRWNASWASGYYLRNNDLIFYPRKPTGDYILRLTYYRRPNTLVPTKATGRVLNVDPLGATVTLDNTPTPPLTPGTRIDVIQDTGLFEFNARGLTLVAVSGPILQLDPADISLVQVGNYVAAEGQSPVAQFVPVEALYLLAQLGAARCLQALGDTEGNQLAQQKIMGMRQALLNMISDRVKSNPMKINARAITRRQNWGNW